MEAFDEHDSSRDKLNPSDDWLRKRQGLAFPVLPPTTPEARHYFFSEIAKYATTASQERKKSIDFTKFAQEWNKSADGKLRLYITPEVLAAYMKTWEKNTNIRASQDLISDALDVIVHTSQVFAAEHQPFPEFLTASPQSNQPAQGVLENTIDSATLPASISTDLAFSHPRMTPRTAAPPPLSHSNSLHAFLDPNVNPEPVECVPMPSIQEEPIEIEAELQISTQISLPPTASSSFPSSVASTPGPSDMSRERKRRRVVSKDDRKHVAVRTCRRCRRAECAGNSDILKCLVPCTVPCTKCGRLTGCRGVDKGRHCTVVP